MTKSAATTPNARAFQPGLVSVVLPTYNSASFLEQRINSIQLQSHHNLEVIVIDGYSTDGTWTMLQEVARADKRWTLHQSSPAGVYSALNEAISFSRGDYLYFAMSDDTCESPLLQKAVHIMSQRPHISIVQCAVAVTDRKGRLLYDTRFTGDFADYFGRMATQPHERTLAGDLWRQLVITSLYLSLTGLVVRRSLVDKAGLFPAGLCEVADVVWTTRLCAYGSSLAYIPEVLATWRRHAGQTTKCKSRAELLAAHAQKIRAISSLFSDDHRFTISEYLHKVETAAFLESSKDFHSPAYWGYRARRLYTSMILLGAWLVGGKRAVKSRRREHLLQLAPQDDVRADNLE